LEIRLTEDPKIPKNTIWIKNQNTRSQDNSYASLIDCPTMIHEILHLFGLVDEYEEKLDGTYNCRAIGPAGSVMHSQGLATMDSVPTTQYEYVSCACKGNQRQCDDEIRKAQGQESAWDECPSSYTRREGQGLFAFDKKPGINYFGGSVVLAKTVRAIKVNKPKNDSLLRPAHFRMITDPLCEKRNSAYLKCAKNAYATSNCKQAPAGCDGSNWLE
jgi:hypothetical protein